MRFVSRLGIVLVAVLVIDNLTNSLVIENQWYEFCWAFLLGLLNAFIDTFIVMCGWSKSWTLISIFSVLLNLFLYWMVYLELIKWLGITANGFFLPFLAALLVAFISILANHFRGYKTR